MAPFQHLQKWLTLTSQCFANFSNAISFGIFFSNIPVFASYYSIRSSTIENTFYIGLVLEIIFCIPALKLIEWRMDYSIMCASFLTMTAYWVQYTAQDNFVVGKHVSIQSCAACSSRALRRPSSCPCRDTSQNAGSRSSKDQSQSHCHSTLTSLGSASGPSLPHYTSPLLLGCSPSSSSYHSSRPFSLWYP